MFCTCVYMLVNCFWLLCDCVQPMNMAHPNTGHHLSSSRQTMMQVGGGCSGLCSACASRGQDGQGPWHHLLCRGYVVNRFYRSDLGSGLGHNQGSGCTTTLDTISVLKADFSRRSDRSMTGDRARRAQQHRVMGHAESHTECMCLLSPLARRAAAHVPGSLLLLLASPGQRMERR